jgi:hypothetical protein
MPGWERIRAIIGVVGLPAALFVGGYKGVMLSNVSAHNSITVGSRFSWYSIEHP